MNYRKVFRPGQESSTPKSSITSVEVVNQISLGMSPVGSHLASKSQPKTVQKTASSYDPTVRTT
jgi:hypothetical protein